MRPKGDHVRVDRRAAIFRRRRVVVVLVAVVVLFGAIALVRSRDSSHRPQPRTASSVPSAAPVLRIDRAPWQLPENVSRAATLADDGRLVVLGGLSDGNKTLASILEIDPQSGNVTGSGSLAEPVHDTAGASVAGRVVVFGGGAAKVSSTVQHVPVTASDLQAQKLSTLPAPRADLVAASVAGQIILAGGYDGKASLADVLTTTDGSTFATLAQLPEPVRYPAVLVHDSKVFLFGGEGRDGDSTAIQVIDPATRTATIAGHLPLGLSHAVAVELGGSVYLVGGRRAAHAIDTVTRIDLASSTTTDVAHLPSAMSDMGVATLGDSAYFLGGENDKGQPQRAVVVASVVSELPTPPPGSAAAAPFDGKLLIADRGNNRLILVDKDKNVLWTFPSPSAPAPPQGFYFPDDAFFAKRGTAIITNEEQQHTIIEIAFPSGQVIASYGHPGKPGAAAGYLNQPDDAYLLADGRVTVADAKNCRIVFLNPDFTFESAIGTKGRCRHDIPRDVAYPNGDTPLANGNFLVSEINGSYVDEVTKDGSVVWSVKLPITYPSDPQQIGPDLYLIADYSRPGGLYEFTREGDIVFSYSFASGEQMLDHPSLVEQLPTGLLCVNDDYRHRVVIIDPATKNIVWQYGQTDHAGTGPNQLNTPDGFDLLAPDNTTPTHPTTG